MDTKLLLVKLITLLYLESKLPDKSNPSTALATAILTHIKLPDNYTGNDFGRDPLIAMRETARWMISNPVDTVYDTKEFLQRLRVNVNDNQGLFDAFYSSIATDYEESALKHTILTYRRILNEYINQAKVKDILKEAYTKAWFQTDSVDWRYFIKEITENLEPYSGMATNDIVHPSIVTDIMLSDSTAVKGVFMRSKAELDETGIIRFGWQGLNRMFGPTGGARRGEFIVIGALQHNFKSGTSLEMFKSAALYNTPKLRDPNKKPLLMRISFENPAEKDMVDLYRSLVENETGVFCDQRYIDPDEAERFVASRLMANGWNVNIVHIDPSEFTYRDLFERIEKFEADGYEIFLLSMDYMPMMSKKGCAQGPAGVEMRDLYRRVRNFTSKRGIITITPHQLSTEAKQLTRLGIDNFVQEIANKGYYDGCRTIDQEIDMEIYQHIVKVNGESYLTFQRGKHRGPLSLITPERDLYTVYKFQQVGTIPDDVLLIDNSRRTVGGKTINEGGDSAWYDGI